MCVPKDMDIKVTDAGGNSEIWGVIIGELFEENKPNWHEDILFKAQGAAGARTRVDMCLPVLRYRRKVELTTVGWELDFIFIKAHTLLADIGACVVATALCFGRVLC